MKDFPMEYSTCFIICLMQQTKKNSLRNPSASSLFFRWFGASFFGITAGVRGSLSSNEPKVNWWVIQ